MRGSSILGMRAEPLGRRGARSWLLVAPALVGLATAGLACSDPGIQREAEGGSGSNPGRDGVVDAGSISATSCQVSSDCPTPSERYCQPCFEGGTACLQTQCADGHCQNAANICAGPISNPCAYKGCGDPCTQCSTRDGGCYDGTCNWLGSCKSEDKPVCSIDAGRSCSAMDTEGLGDCNDVFGWSWTGSKCVAIVGCICVGIDCGVVLADSFTCWASFHACPGATP